MWIVYAALDGQDDLHDAIQDADFIGAVCDPAPKPTQSLQLMAVEEAEMIARHMALEFEGVLSEPLGYYLVCDVAMVRDSLTLLRAVRWGKGHPHVCRHCLAQPSRGNAQLCTRI